MEGRHSGSIPPRTVLVLGLSPSAYWCVHLCVGAAGSRLARGRVKGPWLARAWRMQVFRLLVASFLPELLPASVPPGASLGLGWGVYRVRARFPRSWAPLPWCPSRGGLVPSLLSRRPLETLPRGRALVLVSSRGTHLYSSRVLEIIFSKNATKF